MYHILICDYNKRFFVILKYTNHLFNCNHLIATIPFKISNNNMIANNMITAREFKLQLAAIYSLVQVDWPRTRYRLFVEGFVLDFSSRFIRCYCASPLSPCSPPLGHQWTSSLFISAMLSDFRFSWTRIFKSLIRSAFNALQYITVRLNTTLKIVDTV